MDSNNTTVTDDTTLLVFLMAEYVQDNLDHIHTDTFTQEMFENVLALFLSQFDKESTESDILSAYQLLPNGRTSMHCPIQENSADLLSELQSRFQPEQRSVAWYEFRHHLITASSAYKAIGTPAKQNELICSKCGPMNEYKSTSTEGPMHWGVKYEPVSLQYYSYINDTKVKEYGCIAHPVHTFLGASPDGINVLETSPLYGRMVEIKNPYSREITGNPKEEYWIQCQVQMEVCGLDACDFLETKFTEYASKEEFDADGSFQQSVDGKYKGIILHFFENGSYHYEYAPFMCTQDEYNAWEEGVMMTFVNLVRIIYWKLEDEHCTIIRRNKEWFAWFLPHLIHIQNIIEKEKNGDWTIRLPKRKATKDAPSLLVIRAPAE